MLLTVFHWVALLTRRLVATAFIAAFALALAKYGASQPFLRDVLWCVLVVGLWAVWH